MHKVYINTAKWKNKLHKLIQFTENSNLPDSALEKFIKPAISFIIMSTTPDTEAEKLFYDMWKKANRKDKKVLTKMLISVLKEQE